MRKDVLPSNIITRNRLNMKPSGLPEGQNSLGHGVNNLLLSVNVECSPPQSQQMKKQKNNSEAQAAWRPPLMVEPEEVREDEEPQSLVDHGELDTDAKLYVVKEGRWLSEVLSYSTPGYQHHAI